MKNQLVILPILCGLSSAAMALNPASLLGDKVNNPRVDELKALQQEYRNLMDVQSDDEAKIKKLEYKLSRAEKRLSKAQAELKDAEFNVRKVSTELMYQREIHQEQQKELQRAGQRLTRAWQAAYGMSDYRAANTK